MALPDTIVIGKTYIFNYPPEFVTLPEYTAQAGQHVVVLRQCTDEEADQGDDMERMFHVRTASGWEGVAWASELSEVQPCS